MPVTPQLPLTDEGRAYFEARALRLRSEAISHKRKAAYHRRRSKERMQEFEAMRRELRRFGIRLIIRGEALEVRHGRDESEAAP